MQRRQPLRHRLSLSRRTHSWHPWRLRRTALSLRRTQRPRPRGPHMHRPSRGLSVGSALPRWAWARCSVSKRSPTPTRRVTLAPKTSAMTRKARQPQTALTPRRRFPTSRSCSAEWRWPRASSCTSPCRRSMARKSDSHRRSLRRVLAWRYTESSNYERKIFALASVARRGIARRSLHFQRHARLPSHHRHSRRDVLGALRRVLRSREQRLRRRRKPIPRPTHVSRSLLRARQEREWLGRQDRQHHSVSARTPALSGTRSIF